MNDEKLLSCGFSAWRLLFSGPAPDGSLQLSEGRFFFLTNGLLKSLLGTGGEADEADYINALEREFGISGIAESFFDGAFQMLVSHRVFPEELRRNVLSPKSAFLLEKLQDCCACFAAIPRLTQELHDRMIPGVEEAFAAFSLPDAPDAARTALIEKLLLRDPFVAGRVFAFRRGAFIAVRPDSVKPVADFYGFPGVRLLFDEQFRAFAEGRSNLPLLVNSLPGYGKTSMVVSYALAQKDLVLILADPETLEQRWHDLMDPLAHRSDHRFVVFFDDIDPRKLDWYTFRTNVGGAFSVPQHIMPVLTANYEFPPSIISRGLRVSYPVFDELRCTEMVEDFLRSFGLRNPPANLVSLIGAGYTEEFGQKKFSELSPRTLIRYLENYRRDASSRKAVVAMSQGELITRPDAELFYEFNINLMRSLYGEEYIQRLLKERLREM